MGPKKAKAEPEDVFKATVCIEEGFAKSNTGKEIIKCLSSESFATDGIVKCFLKPIQTPNSIEFLTKTSSGEWKPESHVFIFYSNQRFIELLKNNPGVEVDDLLRTILGHLPDPETERFHIFLTKDRPGTRANIDDKHLEAELNRSAMMKAQDLAADALVLHQTSLQVESIDKHQIAQKVIRLTKSILELINHRSCLASEEDTGFYGSWYPKRSGPPISINKNKVGLNNLWQRYLMQVSKSVNVEQAKVIANCPEFSSLHRAFRTYANCDDEKEAISMLSNKALRPAGASKDALNLGNKRPCVGPETSKKMFKVLTSTDPDLKI